MALNYVVNHSTLKTNLVSWYPLNEYSAAAGAVTRYDAHGSNDLTDNNTTASAAGQWNRGADFEATNTEFLSNASAHAFGDADFSFAWWVKLETGSTNQVFFARDNSGTANREYDCYVNTTNQVVFEVYNGTSTVRGIVTSTTTLSAGTWHFIAVYHDAASNQLGVSIDGGAYKTAATSGALGTGSVAFQVGARETAASRIPLDGIMQDLGIWSKILSTDEIADLYNSGDGMTYGIDFDAAAGGGRNNSTGTSTSWTHVCSGTNRHLVVQVSTYKASGSPDIVSSVTYNGTAMTQLGKDDVQSNLHYYYYYLENPDSGSYTITVNHDSTNYTWGASASYIGVAQSSSIDSSAFDATGTNSRSTTTATTTVVGDNCWVVGGCHSETTVASAGTGTVIRADDTVDNRLAVADSNGFVSTGSQSLIFNGSGAGNTSWGIASIAPVQVAAASTFTPKVMFF